MSGRMSPRARPVGTTPLSMAPPGALVTLVGINAGRGLVRRLSAMGLVPGTQLEVLRGNVAGPLMIRVKGSRIMLGRGIAMKILVAGRG